MKAQLQRCKAYFQKLFGYILKPAGLLVTLTVVAAFWALTDSTKVRTMQLKAELYSNERWWYDRMAAHPSTYSVLCEFPDDITPENYIRECIALASPGEGAALPPPQNMQELRALLWGPKFYDRDTITENSRHANLRRAFDTAEVMFYSTERIFSYLEEGILDKKEANTWLGLLHQTGPHPLLLAAADDAWEFGYVSPEFARWFVDVMSTHPRWKSVKKFYPELTNDPEKWIKKFEKEEADLRFSKPKPWKR